jgi:hypothetical protein
VAVRTTEVPKDRLLGEAETDTNVGVVSNCRSSSRVTFKARCLTRRSFARGRCPERRDFKADHFGESRKDMMRILLRFDAWSKIVNQEPDMQ